MKTRLMFFSLAFCITVFNLAGCANDPEPAEEVVEQKMWEEVSAFSNISMKYMIKNENILFLAGSDLSDKKGVLYKTHDGVTWELIRKFSKPQSLLAFSGDTLYIFNDSLYKYTPSNELINVCYYDGIQFPSEFMDMVFFKGNLFLTTAHIVGNTYKLSLDGKYEQAVVRPDMPWGYGASNFIKNPSAPDDIVYVRPYYYNPKFYQFDGVHFTYLIDGLTEAEKENYVIKSMTFHNGVLYAGFNHPTTIKKLNGNTWEPYTKELPPNPNHIRGAETIAITFSGERLFASTNFQGVLEWRNDSVWVPVSDGLKNEVETNIKYDDNYLPVIFLESFKGSLFAAYGQPLYSIWMLEYVPGVYKLDVNKIK